MLEVVKGLAVGLAKTKHKPSQKMCARVRCTPTHVVVLCENLQPGVREQVREIARREHADGHEEVNRPVERIEAWRGIPLPSRGRFQQQRRIIPGEREDGEGGNSLRGTKEFCESDRCYSRTSAPPTSNLEHDPSSMKSCV